MPWVIASDLHILKKPGMWSSRREISGDDEFSLKQIVDFCIEEKANLLLLGDIVDAVTTLPRPVVILQKHLSRMINKGLKVQYIQGQHEMVVDNSFQNYPWMDLIDGTEHVNEQAFDFMGKRAYALDYFPAAFQHAKLSLVPEDTEILFLHGTASEIVPFDGHFSLELIRENTRVFAGDYHDPITYVDDKGVRITYPGSTHQRSTDEPREKHFLFFEGDTYAEPVEVKLRTRPIIKLTEVDDGTHEIEHDESLPSKLRKPVVLIDRPASPEKIAEIAQKAHVYMTAAADPHIPTLAEVEEYEKKSDEELLERFVDKEEHPQTFEFILDLLNNPAEDAIQRLQENMGILDLIEEE